MNISLISYESFFMGEAEIVSTLLETYDCTFHIRKPKASYNDYVQFLNFIPSKYHVNIIAHDYPELMKAFKLKGIHLSSKKRQEFSSKHIVSTSTHSIAELQYLDGIYDRMFIAPIFPSISKEGYSGNINMNDLGSYLASGRKSKIIALGGIDSKRATELKNSNFDGLAVLGSVWTNNPEENSLEIESNFKKIYQCLN
ncbi:MAG: thiamine phosphate synthase [Bacteroidales bacterium]|jgi:thiamine-phosphate pyrophosphorylase|nr:thiamine phosphate synthase [Bacteroidales bacterium]